MERLLSLLNSIQPISADLLAHLQSILKHKSVKNREFLLQKGQVCSEICFIASGLLHCYYTDGNKKVTSWLMQEGNVIISVRSFFSRLPSYESIQALEDCELYYVTYHELQDTYRLFPEFNVTGRILTERYYLWKDEQAYHLTAGRSRERMQWFLERFPDLILRAPSRYIATFLGITEETFSRQRSRKKS